MHPSIDPERQRLLSVVQTVISRSLGKTEEQIRVLLHDELGRAGLTWSAGAEERYARNLASRPRSIRRPDWLGSSFENA